MATTDNKAAVPAWDGNLAQLTTYEKELRWYVLGTEEAKRGLCGPRAVRALTGRAAEIAMAMENEGVAKVAAAGGCSFLREYVKTRFGWGTRKQGSPST